MRSLALSVFLLFFPILSFADSPRTEKKLSLEFIDTDVRQVIRVLAELKGVNILIDPEVTGNVTVKLQYVTWREAFDAILKLNRLRYKIEHPMIHVKPIF